MIRAIMLLLFAILPVYLICLYVYKKDQDKESRNLLSKLFVCGVVSCIPALILELFVGAFFGAEENMDFVTLFIYVVISIALIEEICKWFFLYKISYNHHEFDHIYDAIVYSVFVSLGFAVFENIFYIIDGGFVTAFFRAVSAVPGHACYAIAMGNYFGLAKMASVNGNIELEKKNLMLSVVVPTILHGLYDFCLLTGNFLFLLVFLAMLVFVYVYSIKTVKKMSNVPNNFIVKQEFIRIFKYCPKCGTKSVGRYCIKCGNNLSNNN